MPLLMIEPVADLVLAQLQNNLPAKIAALQPTFNPVLATLPPFIRVRPSGGPLAKWVNASVEYAMHATDSHRADGDPLLQRLPELLFTECLCDFAAQQADADHGWLAGLASVAVATHSSCCRCRPRLVPIAMPNSKPKHCIWKMVFTYLRLGLLGTFACALRV